MTICSINSNLHNSLFINFLHNLIISPLQITIYFILERFANDAIPYTLFLSLLFNWLSKLAIISQIGSWIVKILNFYSHIIK